MKLNYGKIISIYLRYFAVNSYKLPFDYQHKTKAMLLYVFSSDQLLRLKKTRQEVKKSGWKKKTSKTPTKIDSYYYWGITNSDYKY